MSRYSSFRNASEESPQTEYEACVFLDNAVHHIWNSIGHDHDVFEILNGAHNAINESEWEAA